MPIQNKLDFRIITTLAGKLNYRFAFDKRVTVTDGFGNTQGDWEEQFILWTGKRYLVGGETVVAARLSGNQPVLLTVRVNELSRQIESHWRCRDLKTSEVFNIKNIRPEADREGYIDIMVQKEPAEG